MIRLTSYPHAIPQVVKTGPLYGVVSRSTLLGFHRGAETGSKTVLFVAHPKEITEALANILEEHQQAGTSFERVLYPDNTILAEPVPAKSLMPLHVEPFSFDDLEKLCLLHGFDLYIAYEMAAGTTRPITLRGFEVVNREPPSRASTERYMRDMLYRGNW